MNQEQIEQLWERSRAGQSSVAIGLPPHLAFPEDLIVIRLNAAVPWSSSGPLQDAYRDVLHWLGEDSFSPTSDDGSLRVQLLGEMPLQLQEKGFIAACNQLSEVTGGQALLVFDAVERADQLVLRSLNELLRRESGLQTPWLLSFHEAPQGEVAEWLGLLRETHQDVFLQEPEQLSEGAIFPAFAWQELPHPALRVLRAGAVVGSVFEASLISHLLEISISDVLEALQVCVDHGAPLGDYGNGRFFQPLHSVESLREGMLPSLQALWHERLASLLSATPLARSKEGFSVEEALAAKEEEAKERTAAREGAFAAMVRASMEAQEARSRAQGEADFDKADDAEEDPNEEETPWGGRVPLTEVFAPRGPEEGEPGAGLDPNREPDFFEQEEPPTDAAFWFVRKPHSHDEETEHPHTKPEANGAALRQDHIRAAKHFLSGGRLQEALVSYLRGARQAMATGETQTGIYLTQEAIRLLALIPPSPQRALMEARTLLEMARLQWHGVGFEEALPLQAAFHTILAAKDIAPDNAPPELLGQIATVYAGICYDLGDVPALSLALHDLTQLSRQLLHMQEPLLAAQLLNDQATLYIRLGDPLQASRLLYKARELFEGFLQREPNQAAVQEELAETEHLLARLPLHAPARPGKELDAYAAALQHTHNAEELYTALQRPKEQARVWETQGRLKMELGHTEQALRHLQQAIWVQKRIGDQMGLARSHAAIAEVFMGASRFEEALQYIQESILLNLALGAPIGLAYNRRALDQVLQSAATENQVIPQGLLKHIHQLLSRGEATLGRITVPTNRREGLLHG